MRISDWSSDVCSSDLDDHLLDRAFHSVIILGEAPAVVTQKSRTGQAVRLSRQGSGGRVPPLASESEPDPRRIAGEARRCEGDVVLVTQVPAPPFAGQVDPFDETGDARNELPARARVDLPIRLDTEGVGSRSCEELVAPVPRDSGLDRSEEQKSDLQSLMSISYAVFYNKKKIN